MTNRLPRCPAQAYVDRLTKDLAVELEPFGVTVENQAPFYVATKMSKIRRPRLDAPSPKSWVATGMRQIGCATSVLGHDSNGCWCFSSMLASRC